MIYFDEKSPNKYSSLKKLITPNDISGLTRVRYGQKDGSYVMAKEIFEGSRVLSYGINSDPNGCSFEEDVFEICEEIHMYDGSIDGYPARKNLPDNASFYKEFVTKDNFKSHFDKIFKSNESKYTIKMDIDGCEYDIFMEDNLDIISKHISQISFECHGLIEEHPPEWNVLQKILDIKKDMPKKEKFLNWLNKHFVLFHAHGNNHCPRYMDFPETLEMLYVNKKEIQDCVFIPCNYSMPIEGLDSPNYDGRSDYILDWWL